MKPAMGSVPVSRMFVIDRLEPQPDGTVTAIFPDGNVVSVQPDGSIQTRPPGTAGEWEKAILDGDCLIYYPSGQPNSVPFIFTFTKNVPNT